MRRGEIAADDADELDRVKETGGEGEVGSRAAERLGGLSEGGLDRVERDRTDDDDAHLDVPAVGVVPLWAESTAARRPRLYGARITPDSTTMAET